MWGGKKYEKRNEKRKTGNGGERGKKQKEDLCWESGLDGRGWE